MEDLEYRISQTIMEMPHSVEIGGRWYYLYPITLGKTYLCGRLLSVMKVDKGLITANPYAEALRLAQMERENSLSLIAVHMCKTKEEVFDKEIGRAHV